MAVEKRDVIMGTVLKVEKIVKCVWKFFSEKWSPNRLQHVSSDVRRHI